MTTFQESDHPRTGAGQFATKTLHSNGTVDLSAESGAVTGHEAVSVRTPLNERDLIALALRGLELEKAAMTYVQRNEKWASAEALERDAAKLNQLEKQWDLLGKRRHYLSNAAWTPAERFQVAREAKERIEAEVQSSAVECIKRDLAEKYPDAAFMAVYEHDYEGATCGYVDALIRADGTEIELDEDTTDELDELIGEYVGWLPTSRETGEWQMSDREIDSTPQVSWHRTTHYLDLRPATSTNKEN